MSEITTEQIINHLKTKVRWNYDGTHLKQMCPDRADIQAKPDIEVMFEAEVALAVLLLADVVFTNDHWWMKDEKYAEGPVWPEAACKITSLNVNTNDVLMWGCADACEMTHAEIEEVYDYWDKDPSWGTAVWYCKKMNMMPQKPVADSIRKQSIWDIDSMGLEKNPTDGDF